MSPYVASKFAVEGLTKALAKELPKGMSAVAFNPGVIDTDMLRMCWGDEAGDHESPEEWAARRTVHPELRGATQRPVVGMP